MANDWLIHIQGHETVKGQVEACVTKKWGVNGKTSDFALSDPILVSVKRRKPAFTEGSSPPNTESYAESKALRPRIS